MNPFRSIKDAYTRYRARGRYEQAQALRETTIPQIALARKQHRETRHLERRLRLATAEMLRAELDMGGR